MPRSWHMERCVVRRVPGRAETRASPARAGGEGVVDRKESEGGGCDRTIQVVVINDFIIIRGKIKEMVLRLLTVST